MSEDTARMDPETTGDAAPRVWWLAAALAVVSAATVFRLAMNFSHSYPPGVDAAYYPLQTRAWLVRGHLMYDDLPLYFWINAAFSKVLTIFGMSLNEAVLFFFPRSGFLPRTVGRGRRPRARLCVVGRAAQSVTRVHGGRGSCRVIAARHPDAVGL